MQRAFGGYTVIEVMIFLAISGALLALTIVSIKGQAAHTEFTSSMNNVNSKFQSWIDEVSNGYTGAQIAESSNYICKADFSKHPVLQPAGAPGLAGVGSNSECIVLGKAVQIVTNALPDYGNTIYAYTILGLRTYADSSGISLLSDSISHSNPAAAVSAGADLTEEYKIPDGARVLSIKKPNSGVLNGSRVVGFFTGFKGKNVDVSGGFNNGSSVVQSIQYPFKQDVPPRDATLLDCFKLASSCSPGLNPDPPALTEWDICFGSTRNTDKAMLAILSSNGLGASTKLTMDAGALC